METQGLLRQRFGGYFIKLLLLASFLNPSVSQAQVSGKAYHDVNANGTQQSSNPAESSLANVTVTAYKPDGSSVSTTTNSSGAYSFNSTQLPSGTKVRIEFTALPNISSTRLISGTSVQFVTAGASATNIDLGVGFANDQCQSNPLIVTPCYVETGDPGLDVVVKFSYTNTGTATLDKTAITTSSQAGSMWGEAYSRSRKLIYMSAVLKGHIPLGVEGLDAIYTIDPFSGSANATKWLELTDDLGIAVSPISANPQYHTNATRGVLTAPQNDANAFSDVGKVGIGDIELSADEKTLYIVNLYDKKLYAIDVATKTLVDSYTIPNPGCNNGEARPWAIGEQAGKIYVSVTCDGSASGNPASLTDNSGVSNLTATVYRLDGSSFTSVLSFPLDYPREVPFQYSAGCDQVTRWKPWVSVVPATCSDGNIGYPTPLLTDIEFDDDGHMILGFTDRTGWQFGYDNYGPTGTTLYSTYIGGDILKACKSGTTWAIESTVSGCSSAGGLAIDANDAIGYVMPWGNLAKAGEFYEGDFFHSDGNFDGSGLSYYPAHPEITIGGLVVVPGSGEVMTTTYDPVTGAPNYNTGGVITLSNTSGKRTHSGFQLYATPTGGVTQGKGVGLGDLEALCDGAAIEIGNRIWNDTDQDGIQDADENGIGDVCLEIFADFDNNGTPDGTALGTTTTAPDGSWVFNASNITDGDPSVSGNQAGLQPFKKYLVRVCASDWTSGAGTGDLTGLYLTTTNADATTNGEERDNDATLSGGIPQFLVSTEAFGISNFSLDMGFNSAPPTPPDVTLTKTVNNAATSQGTNVIFTIKVKNEGLGDATGVTVHDTLPVGMTFISAIPNGAFNANTHLWTIGDLPAGDSVILLMTVRIDSVGVNYNTAEIHTLNESDTDSSPNNGATTEDDIDRVCVSVPVPLCTSQGKTLILSIPAGYTNIKWFRNGTEIQGQTSNSLVVGQIGDYTFTADEATCPVEGCCPVQIVEGNCTPLCKPIVCLPVAVARQ
ncbi:MAG: DUF11 domain-containing protein [Saprospiraceae bacterium]|nr:DUF11 domain-containing protein [Saprospiraceae bacterium]